MRLSTNRELFDVSSEGIITGARVGQGFGRTSVGVVDYGAGNLGSLANVLKVAGFRVRVSSDVNLLDDCDVLMLPGVGAFPAAMQKFKYWLDSYICEAVGHGKQLSAYV